MTDVVVRPAFSQASPDPRPAIPPWVWLGGAFLVVASLMLVVPGWAERHQTGMVVLFQVRLLLEGVAYLWAGRRKELPRDLRRVLGLTGAISIVSLVTNLPLFWYAGEVPEGLLALLDTWLFLSYMLSALALLLWPRVPARRWDGLTLLLDLVITAGAMGALLLLEVTFPLMEHTPDPEHLRWTVIYGLAQAANIAGLSVMIVRGRPIPSRRAFWWFVGAQAAYLPSLFLSQLGMAQVITEVSGRVLYVLGVVPALVAVVLIRRDPLAQEPAGAGPAWLRDLSPLPLLTPVLVVVALLNAMTAGPPSRVQPLIIMLILTTLLLVVRVLLSAGDNAARLREEAARERQLQHERLATVGRLAGGLAHEFNNMMTVVVGHAEFAENAVPEGSGVRQELAVIRQQAERAARLTSQLLSFSGQQVFRLDSVTVRQVVDAARPLVEPLAAVELAAGVEFLSLRADPPLVAAALQQLARNGVEAGSTRPPVLRISARTLATSLESVFLAAPAGRYVVFEVEDNGVGIAAEDQPRLFDPFFTRKPVHIGAGLGLAEVYGVVAGHRGGITVRSAPGAGTTMALYLPLGSG